MSHVRLIIDLPSETKLQALQRLAKEAGGNLYRRPDGTFLVRTSNPSERPQAVAS